MPKPSDVFVSVVLIADDKSTGQANRLNHAANILKAEYANYEVLIVDNGLSTSELQTIKEQLSKVACIRVLRLSKTIDTDGAIFAGLEASIGDAVCVLHDNDPLELIPDFVEKLKSYEIVFGVAKNMKRKGIIERWGAKTFYWYSKKYLKIDIPNGSTYFMAMDRSAVNAITRSGRYTRHIRHMSKQVGFSSTNIKYDLPLSNTDYGKAGVTGLFSKAIDLVSTYSNHPLRVLTYFGVVAGILNVVYGFYVIIVNLSRDDIEKGWTSLSLQSSLMFFLLFMILAILAEYIGKILNEVQQEPPYHIMQELSSTVSVADETRRNVTR